MNPLSEQPPTNIRIRGRHAANTQLVRPLPEVDDNFEVFVASDGYCACIRRSVLDFIRSHAQRMGEKETIGLLCGRVCRDPIKGPYTLIMAAGDAQVGEFQSTRGDVRLLASGHTRLRRRLVNAHPDREVVGWYHTHPSYPPRFSYVDVDEQNTWSDPNHIGIVYSGMSLDEPFGVYRGPDSILLKPVVRESGERTYTRPLVGTENTAAAETSYRTQPQPGPRVAPAQTTPHIKGHKPKSGVLEWAGRRSLAIVIVTVIAGIGLVQASGLLRLNRRVSSIEKRLQELLVSRPSDKISEKQTDAKSVNEPMPSAPSPDSLREVDRVDDGELNTPAKPISPETRSGSPSQAQRAANFQAKAAKPNGDGNKRTEKNDKKTGSRGKVHSKPGEQIVPDAPTKSSPQPTVRPD